MTELSLHIERIIQVISDEIEKLTSEGLLSTSEILTKKYEIPGFNYDANGPSYKSVGRSNLVTKQFNYNNDDFLNLIKKSNEYTELVCYIKDLYPEKNNGTIEVSCRCLVEEVKNLKLKRGNLTIEEIIEYFDNDIQKNSVLFKIEIYLQGLTIESDSFQLEPGIQIRRVTKEDFEEKILSNLNSMEILGNITACIEFSGEYSSENLYVNVQKAIKEILTKLSLITSGAVRSVMEFSYFYSFAFGGYVGPGSLIDRNWYGFYTHFIDKGSEDNLCSLFNKISLPKYFLSHENKTVNELTIAYNHYVESVINKGSLEKRIANIVMGFEALMSNDSIELKFKLTNRISKLHYYLEEKSPLDLRSLLKLAYDIRSTYAHGSHLEIKKKRVMNENYGGEKEYLKRLNRILGMLIIIFLRNGVNKSELIELIDNSLIDEESNRKLFRYIEK